MVVDKCLVVAVVSSVLGYRQLVVLELELGLSSIAFFFFSFLSLSLSSFRLFAAHLVPYQAKYQKPAKTISLTLVLEKARCFVHLVKKGLIKLLHHAIQKLVKKGLNCYTILSIVSEKG